MRRAEDIRLTIASQVLDSVFDDCDQYDHDETGGRLIGTFAKADDGLHLTVSGVIEAGPRAKRSPVSFFQDGAYQARVFREVEMAHPEVEHLGNWHTHHVNGLQTLSNGDLATYFRIVNHHSHNPPFFYALLVVNRLNDRSSGQRYSTKHFVFRRNDDQVYEIPAQQVDVVDAPLIWPRQGPIIATPESEAPDGLPDQLSERVMDQTVLAEIFKNLRPYSSKTIPFSWRGELGLIDGSSVSVVVVEHAQGLDVRYGVLIPHPSALLSTVVESIANMDFSSARLALVSVERLLNVALFEQFKR